MNRKIRRELWKCQRCKRAFANLNQSHSCFLQPLEAHFRRKAISTEKLFSALRKAVESNGPVTIVSSKTRIGFQTRMTFAAISVRKDHLVGHLVLASRIPDERFTKIETISPRNHVHHFRLRDVRQLDARFRMLIREAYAVGNQEHLQSSSRKSSSSSDGR